MKLTDKQKLEIVVWTAIIYNQFIYGDYKERSFDVSFTADDEIKEIGRNIKDYDNVLAQIHEQNRSTYEAYFAGLMPKVNIGSDYSIDIASMKQIKEKLLPHLETTDFFKQHTDRLDNLIANKRFFELVK